MGGTKDFLDGRAGLHGGGGVRDPPYWITLRNGEEFVVFGQFFFRERFKPFLKNLGN